MFKRMITLTLFIVLFIIPTSIFAQTTLQTVDFETDGNGYTVYPSDYYGPPGGSLGTSGDYWARVHWDGAGWETEDGSEIDMSVVYSGWQGNWFFAGEDVDNVASVTVTTDAVSISGYSDLQVKVLVGARDETLSSKELGDYLRFESQIDGGGYNLIGQFLGDPSSDPVLDSFQEDTNLDGVFDAGGTKLIHNLQEFTFNITGTGNSLQIRVSAYNGSGEDLLFDYIRVLGITSGTAPTVTTDAASVINTYDATLNGTVIANDDPSNVTFEYGLTTAYGTTVTADQSPVTGTASTAVSKAIAGLSPGTLYHYRVVGSNSFGTNTGDDQTFTTYTEAPTITTQAVTSIAHTTATGNGNIIDLGVTNPTQHGICWNTSGNPTIADSKTEEGTASVTGAFTSSLTSLSQNTTYYYNAYATNSYGTSYGTVGSFTTEQPTIHIVDFETDGDNYTANPSDFYGTPGVSGSIDDYWVRVKWNETRWETEDGAEVGLSVGYTGWGDTWFFAGDDVDGVVGGVNITTDPLPISDYINLQVKVLVGARGDIGSKEAEDYLKFESQIDGGGYNLIGQFLGDPDEIPTTLDFFHEDTDLDGVFDAEGTKLTEAIQEFTFNVSGTGDNIQIRVSAYNSSGEDVLFDNIRILGTSTVPDIPINVVISNDGSQATVSWEAVIGATSYNVYSSTDPYSGFTLNLLGSLNGTSWTAPNDGNKLFYYVVAVN